MMSFLAYITGFFMNFEHLPILTDYAKKKHGIYVKLLLAMSLQLKFELILTYTKAAIDN
jgi:hypothetical protein